MQLPRNALGATLLLLMAQHAGASLIGDGMRHAPPRPFPPKGPDLGPDPTRWATPASIADRQAQARARAASSAGWPGADAADVAIPMQPLAPGEAPTAADPLLVAGDESPVTTAENPLAFAVGVCVRNKRMCAAAVGGAALYGAARVLGALYAPAAARIWQQLLRSHQQDTAVQPRYLLDAGTLPPQVRLQPKDLDPARPPCHSLGDHVNGRWQATEALERSRTQQGTFVDLRDRSLAIRQQLARQMVRLEDPSPAEKLVGDLWSSGMDDGRVDIVGLAPLQPALDAIDAISHHDGLPAYLFKQTTLGRNPLFQLDALPDQARPGFLMAYLSQGGLGLPDADWYGNADMRGRVDAYREHVSRMLAMGGMAPEEAQQAAREVVALETQLAAASEPFVRLATDITLYYNPQTVAAASAQTPRLPWGQLFSAYGMAAPEQLSLGMPDYFRTLDTLLGQVPLQTWRNYLRFHALDDAAPCLAQRFAQAGADFHDGELKGRRSQVPRWARVLEIIDQQAALAMSEPYITAIWNGQIGERVDALTTGIHAALRRRLAAVPWMDPDTRAIALEKAEKIRVDTGHPRRWPDWEGVGTKGQDFLHDVQATRQFVHHRNIAQIGMPVDTDEWKLSAQSVDAYQDTFQNRIVLPAAILQPPFFDPDADDALNYGGIGVVLGHEMAHGFDSIGSGVAADGSIVDWWSSGDRARFESIAERLAAQVARYQVNGRDVDGTLTLDENLADLGGLALALDALQERTKDIPDPMIDGMTREQRFFANFAFCWRRAATAERTALDMDMENHAPNQVRADLGPSNMPAFSAAFGCRPGDPMARNETERVAFL